MLMLCAAGMLANAGCSPDVAQAFGGLAHPRSSNEQPAQAPQFVLQDQGHENQAAVQAGAAHPLGHGAGISHTRSTGLPSVTCATTAATAPAVAQVIVVNLPYKLTSVMLCRDVLCRAPLLCLLQVARIAVGGMTCGACSGAVERGLRALSGVQHAAVSLTQVGGQQVLTTRMA